MERRVEGGSQGRTGEVKGWKSPGRGQGGVRRVQRG